MPFKDLDEVLGSPKKELPIGGRTFTFPDRISAETGQVLVRLYTRAVQDEGREDPEALILDLLPEEGWEGVQREVLGRSSEDLIGDGLTGDQIAHVFQTLVAWHLYGEAAAEARWEAGNDRAPNRQARRSGGAVRSSRGRGSRAGSQTHEQPAALAVSGGSGSSNAGGS